MSSMPSLNVSLRLGVFAEFGTTLRFARKLKAAGLPDVMMDPAKRGGVRVRITARFRPAARSPDKINPAARLP